MIGNVTVSVCLILFSNPYQIVALAKSNDDFKNLTSVDNREQPLSFCQTRNPKLWSKSLIGNDRAMGIVDLSSPSILTSLNKS